MGWWVYSVIVKLIHIDKKLKHATSRLEQPVYDETNRFAVNMQET